MGAGRQRAARRPASTSTNHNTAAPATKNASSKPARLENGVTVNVPEFISTGERIRVNPQTGEYLDRAKD